MGIPFLSTARSGTVEVSIGISDPSSFPAKVTCPNALPGFTCGPLEIYFCPGLPTSSLASIPSL